VLLANKGIEFASHPIAIFASRKPAQFPPNWSAGAKDPTEDEGRKLSSSTFSRKFLTIGPQRPYA